MHPLYSKADELSREDDRIPNENPQRSVHDFVIGALSFIGRW